MKRVIVLLCLAIVSCKPSTPELRLKITTSHGDYEDPGHSIEVFKDDYFEMRLSSITYKDGTKKYIAEKDKELPEDGYKYTTVVNSHDSTIFFSEPTEFLNYVSERGYELTDKKETRNRIDYTFKKK